MRKMKMMIFRPYLKKEEWLMKMRIIIQ